MKHKASKSKPRKASKAVASIPAAVLPATPVPVKVKPGPKVGEGRDPVLTPDLIDQITRAMRTGMPETWIGPLLSPPMSRGIITRWKELGERPGAKQIYVDFVDALRRAKAKRIMANFTYWSKHCAKDYRAARDMLKLDVPELFVKTVVNYTPEQWQAFTLKQLEAIEAGMDPFQLNANPD